MKLLRKIVGSGLAAGATLSVGLLSFAGMFAFSSSLIWCSTALALAVIFELQVNLEGISLAFLRIFSPHYLALGIVRNYLLKHNEDENLLIQDYKEVSRFIAELESTKKLTREQKEQLDDAIQRRKKMELFFLKQLNKSKFNNIEGEQRTEIEIEAEKLLTKDADKLKSEIKRKKIGIRLSWLFAIGGGICTGLATLSAIQTSIATLTVLSLIPGGALIGLAGFVAAAYALLLYQSISDMIQEYSGNFRGYFKRRENESKFECFIRCSAVVFAAALAVFATFATAGAWWHATKHGASLLYIGEKIASIIRTITISFWALPTVLFCATNSIESIEKIKKNNYRQFLNNTLAALLVTLRNDPLQFINPFRIAERIISYTAHTLLFIGHTISVGLISSSDLFNIQPFVYVVTGAAEEYLTDYNYLTRSNKKSIALQILFLPITLSIGILKVGAVIFDCLFTWNLDNSWDKMFPSKPQDKQNIPKEPTLSKAWHKQEFIESCDHIAERLQNKSSEKVKSATELKQLVKESNENDDKEQIKIFIRETAAPLSKNRFHFWNKEKPRSEIEIENAITNFSKACLGG